MAVNKAPLRVMEKAGLRLVRTFHLPWPYPIVGDQFGDVEYALDKAGWQLVMTAASSVGNSIVLLFCFTGGPGQPGVSRLGRDTPNVPTSTARAGGMSATPLNTTNLCSSSD